MIEGLRSFIDHQVPLSQILIYYIYFGGWVIKSFFPVFILLAALFSISILTRKNEILAMKASGISLYRITLPFMVATLILSIGHFYYNEYLFPPANQKRVEIKEFTIKKRSKHRYNRVTNVRRQIDPGYFYTMAIFNIERNEGSDLKIYKTESNHLKQFISAPIVTYENNIWQAKNGIVRTFDDSAHESYSEFTDMNLPKIKDKPEDLSRRIGDPGDMGLEELKSYIKLMKRAGSPYVREAIDLKLKYSFPLTSLIVVLLSIPIASNPRKGGIAVSFALGTLIALIYFVLFRVSQSAGYNEKIPALVAIWGVNGFFFIISIIALIKVRK